MLRKLNEAEYPLAKRFYKSSGYGGAPGRGEDCYVWMQESKIIAAVRIQPEDDCFFLRALVVLPNYRGEGVGRALMTEILNRRLYKDLWCFPLHHLEGFYQRLGFQLIDPKYSPYWYKQKFERLSKTKKIICMNWLASKK